MDDDDIIDIKARCDDDVNDENDTDFYHVIDNKQEERAKLVIMIALRINPSFTAVKEKPSVILPLRIIDDIREIRNRESSC